MFTMRGPGVWWIATIGFEEIFDTVKQLGIKPTSPVFVHAFGVLGKLPERVWQRKLDNFKELG